MANAQLVYHGLLQRGLPPHIAAAFAGNFRQESNFRPTPWNKRENACGLAQWRGNRLTGLRHMAGTEQPDLDAQLDYVMHELQGPERAAWGRIQRARTPAEAAELIDRYYERSAGTERAHRVRYANEIYGRYGGTRLPPPPQVGAGTRGTLDAVAAAPTPAYVVSREGIVDDRGVDPFSQLLAAAAAPTRPEITDLSDPNATYGRSATRGAQPYAGIVLHHARGTPESLVRYQHQGDPVRGGHFGYHLYVGRDGQTVQGAPGDRRINHIKGAAAPQRRGAYPNLSNRNALGVSLIGAEEGATPEQEAALQQLVPWLQTEHNIPRGDVYGHGELQTDRMATEGSLAPRFREGGSWYEPAQPAQRVAVASAEPVDPNELMDLLTGGDWYSRRYGSKESA